MRSLSSEALTKIAQSKGNEPITIVEIDWGVGGGPKLYADRDVDGIPGRILSLGNLDNVIDVLSNSSSQSIDLSLDDSDGEIKRILDSSDVHQRDVRVYQYFHGLSLSDRFLLFSGKISSPISWTETGEFKFSVVSQIEDREFGFSAEEGQFRDVPRSLVGKAWPVVFGTCLDVPALRLTPSVSGSTLCGVGILSGEELHNQVPLGSQDCALGQQLAVMSAYCSILGQAASMWAPDSPARSRDLLDQANAVRAQITQMVGQRERQLACASNARESTLSRARENGLGCNPLRILGGEDFPQNRRIRLSINGGLFEGTMNGQLFTILKRWHPENDAAAREAFDSIEESLCEQETPAQPWDFSIEVPPAQGAVRRKDPAPSVLRRKGFVICNQRQTSRPSVNQVAKHFWADAGARVTIASDERIYYIASITPGSVLAVKAWKQFEGERRLVNVPNNLWGTEVRDYGPFSATYVYTTKPLSSIQGQGWEDDVYVTYQSTIGPNTVDILRYIIDNWTDLSYDATTFNAVETKLDPFPSNFAVLDRRNTVDLIKDIAFQARCAIWLSNGTFYLKYLPEEPTSDATIDQSDVEFNSVELTTTSTENLVTKMVVSWRLSYAEEDSKIILRHNMSKYGTKEESFDWFIYNQPDIILKAATFWLIRLSNTWKKLKFKTFLNHLNLETFDTVTLDLPYQSSAPVKAIVEKADYNSDDNSIQFECLVPVKFGTMVKYDLFWPGNLSPSATFPTVTEIRNNLAGGGGIGAQVQGALPTGTLTLSSQVTNTNTTGGLIRIGGPNVVWSGQSDRGDPTPTDVGFEAQPVFISTTYANLISTPNPNPNLTLNYIDPLPLPTMPQVPGGAARQIDIRTTQIIDSDTNRDATLDSIIRRINDGDLVIDTDAKFGDSENSEAFDFQFDDEGGKFGAGTAFLKDGES